MSRRTSENAKLARPFTLCRRSGSGFRRSGSPYFRYSSFWASKPKQAAEMTGLIMPTASLAVLRFAALRPSGWLRGRASQMTGRCVGGACMRPLSAAGPGPFATPATRPRSTPTGDYPPSRCSPWWAADDHILGRGRGALQIVCGSLIV